MPAQTVTPREETRVLSLLSRGDALSQLVVRDIDAEVVRALKRRAARHGRSAEAEHREILKAALRRDLELGSFKAMLASMPDVGADEDFAIPRDMPRQIP